jgi:hypothetical protein
VAELKERGGSTSFDKMLKRWNTSKLKYQNQQTPLQMKMFMLDMVTEIGLTE